MTETNFCRICGSQKVQNKGCVQNKDGYYIDCNQCGSYTISGDTLRCFPNPNELFPGDRWHELSATVRRRSKRNKDTEVHFKNEDWEKLLDGQSIPRDPMQQLDSILLELADLQKDLGDFRSVSATEDLYLGFCKNKQELKKLVGWAKQSGYIDTQADQNMGTRAVLSLDGWQRVNELQKPSTSSEQAFVSMWFTESTDDVYKEGIKPAIEHNGLKAIRIDEKPHNEKN
ncbi:MAG: hypothetical protein IPJ88_18065 [Myxococcales bacterium]|nr:MAG: hypothetical protein IPJ88_18065 [Myxococcales bacterium]